MRQHTHNIWESMCLHQRQEFEGLHFKPQTGIDQQDGYVGYLSQIDHGAGVIWTLNKGDSLLLVTPQSDRPVYLVDLVLGIEFDQRSDQG